ncbi:MAG: helix-turn-helix domain-containing protein [Oscillospiraceae bacterium]|nr:helix-turn-helix domain-containing protein [Oscillospiraceae bacterium]
MKDKELERYFGKAIRDKRLEKKITQEQLSELVGISVTYLRSVEHGSHSITWKIWLNICKVLQLDIKDFIDKV